MSGTWLGGGDPATLGGLASLREGKLVETGLEAASACVNAVVALSVLIKSNNTFLKLFFCRSANTSKVNPSIQIIIPIYP